MSLNLYLGELSEPNRYQQPLDLRNTTKAELLPMLRMMFKIRRAEEMIADMIEEGIVKCPCHLGVGQEAVPVGMMKLLTPKDRVFGTHRAHAHYLAMGGGSYELFAEVLGKVTGCSKGMGGSMHLYAQDKGFYGSVPIVGGTVPIAVGAGLAAKLDGGNDVGVCFFGDGTAEEGVVHESLNLAASHKLPVLFVCENNLYSSHLDISLRQPADRVARYADAHVINNRTIDGNDVLEVEAVTAELLKEIRAGKGPGFLEVVTYRWRGHVGPKEDIDVGVRRSIDELTQWKKRGPIRRLAEAMISAEMLTEEEYKNELHQIDNELHVELERAKNDPYPDDSALFDYVYASQEAK